MNIGDVVAMNGCKIEFGTKAEGGTATYRAPKGERFVFLLLGSTPIDGSAPLDPDGVLKELGWSRPSQGREEIARYFADQLYDSRIGHKTDYASRYWDALTQAQRDECYQHADHVLSLSKLKENGLSREELWGSARASRGAAGPSDCAENDARRSDGGCG